MRQIVLDTETTGLDPKTGDRVIEIGCVEIVDRRRTGVNLHFYLNPQRESHEEALRVHGLTSEFLSDKPKFEQVADQLLNYLADAELVIHNAPFDMGFLNNELALCKLPTLENHISNVIDTLAMAKELFPGKRNSLDTLCERFGVNNSNRKLHGALLDAQLLADVYICMTRGQNSLLLQQETDSNSTLDSTSVDFSKFDLPIVYANANELSEHQKILELINSKSDCKTIFKQ